MLMLCTVLTHADDSSHWQKSEVPWLAYAQLYVKLLVVARRVNAPLPV